MSKLSIHTYPAGESKKKRIKTSDLHERRREKAAALMLGSCSR